MDNSEPPFSFSAAAARAVLAAFAVVLALSAAWALRAPTEAQSIRDGSFIRQSGASDIYRVNIVNGKQFKWLVVNEAAFCSYGCPWGSVINVSRSVMARYTTSTLARRGSNTAVWRFAPSGDSGTRRWLNITAREFEDAGFDWDAVHSITTTDFNQYTRGSDLTCADFNVCSEPPRIIDARNLSFNAGERVTSRRVATISDRDTRLRDLTVHVSGLPSGWRHSFSTSSGRLTVSGTASSRAGTHRVTITASDGRGSDTETFTVTVNQTHDPEITLTDDGFAVQAGERVTSRRVATISDRDTRLRDLTVHVSGLPAGLTHNFSTSNGQLTVSGTAPSSAGTHRVTIRASDGQGSDTERFTITVAAPDCAETIQDGSFIRRSGTQDVYRVKITAGGKQFKWLILNEAAFNSYGVAWARICDTSQSVLNRYTTSNLARRGSDEKVWRFASSGDSGTRRWLNITAREFERAGYDWDAVFSLRSGDFNAYTAATPPTTCDNVDGRNICDEPPIVVIHGDQSWVAGSNVSERVATVSDADTPLRDLTVDVSGLPSGWRHSFSTSSGQLTVGGTAPSSAGSHRVTITASDGRGSDTETFTITVAAPPPDCAETIQDGSFIRQSGTANVYRVRIANSKQFKWPILNEAAFNSYGVAWSRICDTSQSVLDRYTTSDLARRGSDEEVWRFESSGDSGTRRWLNITASEFERAGFDWDAVFSLRSGDFNAYTAATPPTTCDNVDGRNVCDEPEESTTTGGTNTPPEITHLTAPLTVTEGQSVGETQVATVTDREDALQLNRHVRINGLPPGLAAYGLSSTGRLTISGTVAADAAGTYTATIAANDGTNLGVAEDFQIIVLPGEDLPTFDPAVFVVEQRLILGRSATVQLSGASGGSQPLRYVLRDTPAGMTFDADALTVSGTPTGTAGSHTMYLRATDSRGLSAEQRIMYTIFVSCVDDRTEEPEPLGTGDTRTWEGEWTSQDCTTARSQFITDHIGHYRDIYSFVTSEAVEVTIDLESDDVGTYIHLLDNDGQRVDLSSASSDGNDARVAARLKAGQKYWVRATTAELGDVGSYTLTVTADRDRRGESHELSLYRWHRKYWSASGSWLPRDQLACDDAPGDRISCRVSAWFDLPDAGDVEIWVARFDMGTTTSGSRRWYLGEVDEIRVEQLDRDGQSASVSRSTRHVDIPFEPGGSAEVLVYKAHLTAGSHSLTAAWSVNTAGQADDGVVLSLAHMTYAVMVRPAPIIAADTGYITLTESALARAATLYGPVLVLDAKEQFRPVAAEAMIENSSLMRHQPATERTERAEQVLNDAIEQADVTLTGGTHEDLRTTIDRIVSGVLSGDIKRTAEGARVAQASIRNVFRRAIDAGEDIRSLLLVAPLAEWLGLNPDLSPVILGPVLALGQNEVIATQASVDDLVDHNHHDYYLDLFRAKEGGEGNSDKWKQYWVNDGGIDDDYENVVYVHVTEDGDWKSIQWWFFYVYNNADNFGPVAAFDHEGDWEAVTLWFEGKQWSEILGDAAVQPDQVGFAAHGGGSYLTTAQSCLRANPVRLDYYPTVYVSANNHPAYPRPGDFGVLGTDDAGGDGPVLVPVGRGETLAGGGRMVDVVESYTVRRLMLQRWAAWQGRWGAVDVGALTHQLGPHGPLDEGKVAASLPSSVGWSTNWSVEQLCHISGA